MEEGAEAALGPWEGGVCGRLSQLSRHNSGEGRLLVLGGGGGRMGAEKSHERENRTHPSTLVGSEKQDLEPLKEGDRVSPTTTAAKTTS